MQILDRCVSCGNNEKFNDDSLECECTNNTVRFQDECIQCGKNQRFDSIENKCVC